MENGIHELTAGYALDVLDADERWAYETHLVSCERCREELTSFWETAEALAVAASGPAPSQGLRGRILAAAGEERRPDNERKIAPLHLRESGPHGSPERRHIRSRCSSMHRIAEAEQRGVAV